MNECQVTSSLINLKLDVTLLTPLKKYFICGRNILPNQRIGKQLLRHVLK